MSGYALIVITGRSLEPAEFGLFLAFWGVLFGIGGSLSTIEQEAARQTASGGDPAAPIPAVAASGAVLAGLAAAVTLFPPVALRLFGDADSKLGLVVLLATVGFAAQFAVRGILVGSGSTRHYAGIIVTEAVSRLVLLVTVVIAFGLGLRTAAVCVAAGSFAWLAWFGRARRLASAEGVHRRTLQAAVRRAGSLMFAAALMSSVITGYPAMVSALREGPPGAAGGAVFAALTVSRIPLLLISPIQAVAVPTVLRWRAQADASGGSRLRTALVAGTLLTVVVGAVGGVVGWLWGPAVVRLVYTAEYAVAPAAVGTLVLSALLLAWVLLMSAALVALSAYRWMTVMWSVAVAATVVWLLVSRISVVETTAVGALVGPIAAAAVAIPALWSLTAPAPRPSSVR